MKRKFTFLITAAMMLLTMATTGRMWGQKTDPVTIYSETFGDNGSSNTAVASYTGYSATTDMFTGSGTVTSHYTGIGKVGKNSVDPSSGYTGVSGKSAVWYQAATGTNTNGILTISGIDISGYSDLSLSFGMLKKNGTNTTNTTTVTYSIDEGTPQTFSFSHPNDANWHLIEGTLTGTGSSLSITFTTNTTGGYTTRYDDIIVTGVSGGGSNPSISANNVNITYDATGGSIAYTLNNATGNVTAALTTGDWLTLGEVTASEVPFTCSANEAAVARTATVTLSFTDATDKVVTITQAAAPLTTIPAIFAKATEVGSTQTDVNVTFNNWKVVGKSYSNAYVSDGQYGLILYKSGGIDFAIGDQLSGTVATKVQLFTGGAELVGLSTSTTGLTVTHNQSFEPYAISLADIFGEGIYYGSYVDLGNLTYSNDNFTDGNNVITPYNTFSIQNYPTLESGKTYRVKGVYIQYNNTTKRIAPVFASDFTEFSGPSITLTPATANPFTYVENHGPSAQQDFTVALENETSKNITATITTGTDYFEIKNGENWASATTINIDNTTTISVRMKAGLALDNNYAGVMTLTNEDATDVVVNLSGSVTGSTYTIEQYSLPATAHGTITFAPSATVEAGTEVTLTATPDAGYDFTANSWVFYKQSGEDIVVDESIVATNNVITMPAYDIWVDATFTAKPTYEVTCVANPVAGGIIEASPASAYQGQTVTLSYVPETGYSLVKIAITKTSDGSITGITPTASGDNYTFTMPAYAVTATATFVPATYVGNFVKFTGDIAEGDYLMVYNGYAMNNTVSNSKFGATSVSVSNNIVSDPSSAIVWHIAPIAETEYWTIYNAAKDQYANATGSSTNVSLVDVATYATGAQWKVTVDQSTYDFRCKANEGQSTTRYIRMYNDVFGHYAASNGGALTLYKYTELTESTITFNGNGGTFNQATTYTQNVYNGVATALTANQFAKANSVFAGWALTADGDVTYADQAAVTINADLNLYAKWNDSYTAMADDQIVGGTVQINGEEIVEVAEGTQMTLTYTANLGYAFGAWNVYKADDPTTTVTVENNQFNMPAYDVIVSASFVEVTTYSLVTNVSQIVSGKHYIIVGKKNDVVKAMGYDKGNNRHAVVVTETNSTIPETDGVYEFVINGPIVIEETNYYTIYDTNENSTGYLYAAGGTSSNYLKTQTTNNNKGQWTIGIAAETSVATIRAKVSGRNLMQYNASSTIFSCYSGAQDGLYLYVKVNDNDFEYYGSEITYTETIIPAGETITVGTGSVMTVPSTFTNTDPEALIIEDGGQIIHDNAGVKATIKKNIQGYGTGTGNYYFLVSPLTENINPDSVTNMIADPASEYDLYQWDGGESLEWRNYKKAPFTLDNGVGFLYANKNDVELTFTGTLKQSNETVTVNPAYDAVEFGAWSLVGNPFPCEAYLTDTTGLGKAFYKMNTAGNGFIAVANGAIAPLEGIFVQASAASQSFKFTRNAPNANSSKGGLNIQVAKVNARGAQTTSDNAIVRFDGGNSLEKFSFGDDNAKIYIPQGNKDYAVVSTVAYGEMPVNFKAAEDGTYTVNFSADGVAFNYLHLIDNKTGMDVDLLQTPSYSFEATTGDRANRFRLVFRGDSVDENQNDNDNENFAFISNGNIVVNGNGVVEIIDILGRVISTKELSTVNGQLSTPATPGVYVVRLTNGRYTKTQKMIINK